MYLTRPKSSKGRSRPAVSSPLCAGDTERTPAAASPETAAADGRPDTKLRSRSQPAMWPRSPEEEVLLTAPAPPAAPAPPQSLNKYKVLPSIERRRSEQVSLDNNMSALTLSDRAVPPQRRTGSPAGNDGIRPRPPPPDPPGGGGGGSLLLAVRAPCGRRFQQHFESADTLLTVKVSAEARYGDEYGEGVSIETVDVPRRSFTDMDMTLAQCGVVNRSVLCITQNHEGARPQNRA